MNRLLVVGARKGSLGQAIQDEAIAQGYSVTTAGVSGDEELKLDLVNDSGRSMEHLLHALDPRHVVCTAGINGYEGAGDEWVSYMRHFQTNVVGPMRLLDTWQKVRGNPDDTLRHYVAISSNSARVPRTGSAQYCASKAALSMALRVKAREGSGRGSSMLVYGYEPGLLAGTPMTDATAKKWANQPLSRMRDARLSEGIPAWSLARLVVLGLSMGPEMNGMLVPFDADES